MTLNELIIGIPEHNSWKLSSCHGILPLVLKEWQALKFPVYFRSFLGEQRHKLLYYRIKMTYSGFIFPLNSTVLIHFTQFNHTDWTLLFTLYKYGRKNRIVIFIQQLKVLRILLFSYIIASATQVNMNCYLHFRNKATEAQRG